MSTVEVLRETAAALRTEATRLEAAARELEATGGPSDTGLKPVFDPDTDTPPVPLEYGVSQHQDNWVCVLLWSQLRSINVRQERGATPAESVEIAKSSGYQDGRAWNQWHGWEKDEDGGRWITEEQGMDFLRTYYEKVGRSIPEDLA